MASENKKNKARNSYITNGGEKFSIDEWKIKRLTYFTKRERLKQKRKLRQEESEIT